MALLAKNNYLGKFLYLLCIFISPVLFGPARRRDTLEYHQQQSGAQAGWTGLSDQKRSSWTTSVFILAKKLSDCSITGTVESLKAVRSHMRQEQCLAAASAESGGRWPAAVSVAVAQAGRQAVRSCPRPLLACKASPSLQRARPALDHRQDHVVASFPHQGKQGRADPAVQETVGGAGGGRGTGEGDWAARHVGACFQEERTVAKLLPLGAWRVPR